MLKNIEDIIIAQYEDAVRAIIHRLPTLRDITRELVDCDLHPPRPAWLKAEGPAFMWTIFLTKWHWIDWINESTDSLVSTVASRIRRFEGVQLAPDYIEDTFTPDREFVLNVFRTRREV